MWPGKKEAEEAEGEMVNIPMERAIKAELGTCPNMLRVLSILYVPTAIDRALETHLFLAASSSLLVLVLVECKRQVIANDFDIPVICHHSTKYLSGGFVKRVCNLFSAD